MSDVESFFSNLGVICFALFVLLGMPMGNEALLTEFMWFYEFCIGPWCHQQASVVQWSGQEGEDCTTHDLCSFDNFALLPSF